MKKVFIDLGANKGQSINYVLHSMFKNEQDYEIHSFETLPLLATKLQQHFSNNDKVHVYHAAVWNMDGFVKFHVSSNSTESGTLLTNKRSGRISEDVYIKVPSIDLARWIKENLNKEDYNILKFDIEGAEYVVLRRIMEEGCMDYFNEIHGEFHFHKLDTPTSAEADMMKAIEYAVMKGPIPYKYWDRSNYPGLVDYKKGTRPSLASSKILDYDKEGNPIPYIEPDEEL